MGLDVRIEGAAKLKRLAAQIRVQGRKDLSRQMGAALERATRPMKEEIAASAAATMPSGYSGTFTASLRHRQSRRTSSQRAELILWTHADGKGQRRDIEALEAGTLRHPLYGRRGRTWYVTRIRAGFHKRGTDGAADRVVTEIGKVVEDFTEKLIS